MARTQPYRILKGLRSPTTVSMADLRAIGFSFDRIWDRIGRSGNATTNVTINGELVAAIVQRAAPRTEFVVALNLVDGNYTLVGVDQGEKLAADSIPVQSLEFLSRNTLAIVEDVEAERMLLHREMLNSFKVFSCGNGKSFLQSAAGLARNKAPVIDWGLPDMDGEALVRLIPEKTSAPIFILTGDGSASESIARAMDSSDVHHAVKPANSLILSKRIMTAIRAAN